MPCVQILPPLRRRPLVLLHVCRGSSRVSCGSVSRLMVRWAPKLSERPRHCVRSVPPRDERPTVPRPHGWYVQGDCCGVPIGDRVEAFVDDRIPTVDLPCYVALHDQFSFQGGGSQDPVEGPAEQQLKNKGCSSRTGVSSSPSPIREAGTILSTQEERCRSPEWFFVLQQGRATR